MILIKNLYSKLKTKNRQFHCNQEQKGNIVFEITKNQHKKGSTNSAI